MNNGTIPLSRFLAGNNDTHQTMAMCSDQGIWQPVNFECIFDPLAVNLKDGANYGKPQSSHWSVAQIEIFSKVRLMVSVNLAFKK